MKWLQFKDKELGINKRAPRSGGSVRYREGDPVTEANLPRPIFAGDLCLGRNQKSARLALISRLWELGRKYPILQESHAASCSVLLSPNRRANRRFRLYLPVHREGLRISFPSITVNEARPFQCSAGAAQQGLPP